jgi:hypothetical protein
MGSPTGARGNGICRRSTASPSAARPWRLLLVPTDLRANSRTRASCGVQRCGNDDGATLLFSQAAPIPGHAFGSGPMKVRKFSTFPPDTTASGARWRKIPRGGNAAHSLPSFGQSIEPFATRAGICQ